MSLSTTLARYQYSGNGVTTTFSFPAVFINPADLTVDLRDAQQNQVAGPLNGTGTYSYTLSGTQDAATGEYLSGANLVFNTAPQAGWVLTIFRDPPQTQTLALVSGAKFPAESVNTEFDKVTMLAQALMDRFQRTLTAPIQDNPAQALTLPPAVSRANFLLGFDAAGNPALYATTPVNVVNPRFGPAFGLAVNPTGNTPLTDAIIDAEGVAASATLREFSGVFGITSAQPLGVNLGTNNDKVALYAAAVANHSATASDANTWATNFVEVMNAGYLGIGQVIEADINNNTGVDRTTPLAQPNTLAGTTVNAAIGIEVSGAGSNRNTVAFAVDGAKWQFGFMALSDISQACFYASPSGGLTQFGLDLEGSYAVAAIGIGIAGDPIANAGAMQIRQGGNNNLLVRPHQNLATGTALAVVNDANNAFVGLELLGNPVQVTVGGGAALILNGSGVWTANGAGTVGLGTVAPAGAHATPQEWLTLTDTGGTIRYIPAF